MGLFSRSALNDLDGSIAPGIIHHLQLEGAMQQWTMEIYNDALALAGTIYSRGHEGIERGQGGTHDSSTPGQAWRWRARALRVKRHLGLAPERRSLLRNIYTFVTALAAGSADKHFVSDLEPAERDDRDVSAQAFQYLGLTRRERDVLQLVADGMTDQEIALALGLRTPTINKHLHAILIKIGAASRTAAAVRAFRLGLIV